MGPEGFSIFSDALEGLEDTELLTEVPSPDQEITGIMLLTSSPTAVHERLGQLGIVERWIDPECHQGHVDPNPKLRMKLRINQRSSGYNLLVYEEIPID